MNVAAEDFQTCLLVLLQQWRAGEADEDRAGHECLHRAMQLAALRAMTFIDEDKQIAHRLTGLRLQVPDELLEVLHPLFAELMDQ